MKKAVLMGLVLALTVSTVQAKKAGGMKFSSSKKTPATVQQSTTQQKADADFNNTPNQTMPNAGAAQQAQGNRLGNFVTGAAAGYLLSEALSPTEAQAQTPATNPTEQLTKQVQQAPAVPTFKAIDPQNDPYLIEKTLGYLRYCLNGVQYMVGTNNSQLPPTLMVDKTNAPMQCVISQ
ncbi:hypothetical protein P9J82_00160 [Glaesserella parasuis]|uniref:Uncharacterized protein n=3 Tax=Glaesserella parasuis TaxID=738 RepID=B8F3G8_GLAP5|nr:hypothetical protein [Glaesserella parasuis]AGO16419.1 hypothetical protein K756_06195 [Glaesserella parasuis ZJ0906]ACL31870.1 conserved hypothetical protein [Glaesserella parasuis SH0165]EMY47173.1 hypothetical protein OE7_00467 [Glaesserella parasuis gx033]KDB47171.1 hypothetical protein HPS9_02225 [Glaesserella parasuis HPS9]KDD80745.1 hypothetical protein HPS42_06850 [Glaesserella parasuis ST4-2]